MTRDSDLYPQRPRSVPVLRIGTFGLAVGAACAFFLGIAV
jgi:hypothetical protein